MWGFFICCLSVATINLHLSISSLILLYSDLAFSSLCLVTTVAWNSSRVFWCFSTSELLAVSAAASLSLDCMNSDCIVYRPNYQ